eukprot:scaffold120133_cov47-Phaeocystis_antarctica.AAC.1
MAAAAAVTAAVVAATVGAVVTAVGAVGTAAGGRQRASKTSSSAYAQPLVARQPNAQASLASSRDRSPPLKSVSSIVRAPPRQWTPSSQYGVGGDDGGSDGHCRAVAPWVRATSASHRNASAARDIR